MTKDGGELASTNFSICPNSSIFEYPFIMILLLVNGCRFLILFIDLLFVNVDFHWIDWGANLAKI
jgi:hypothetical protein